MKWRAIGKDTKCPPLVMHRRGYPHTGSRTNIPHVHTHKGGGVLGGEEKNKENNVQ